MTTTTAAARKPVVAILILTLLWAQGLRLCVHCRHHEPGLEGMENASFVHLKGVADVNAELLRNDGVVRYDAVHPVEGSAGQAAGPDNVNICVVACSPSFPADGLASVATADHKVSLSFQAAAARAAAINLYSVFRVTVRAP